MHILVATARKIDQQDFVLRQGRGELGRIGQGVGRLERRDDAFETAEIVEGLQGFGVGDPDVFGAGAVLEPGVLGPTPG